MTTVLFLMWLSDITGGLGVAACLSAVCGLAALMLIWMPILTGLDSDTSNLDVARSRTKSSLWLFLPMAIAIWVPSPTTIKIIAASHAVQVSANTELG